MKPHSTFLLFRTRMALGNLLGDGPLLPVLLLIASAQIAISQGSGSATDALTKAEYAKIAKARLEPLFPPGARTEHTSIETLLAKYRGVALDCETLKSEDKELQSIAAEYKASMTDVVDSTLLAQRLHGRPNALQQTLKGMEVFLQGALLRLDETANTLKDSSNRNDDLLQNQRRYVLAFQRAYVNDMLMPRVAAKFSGPRAEGDRPLVRILIKEMRYLALAPDTVGVINESGKTLNNCTIVVRLTGRTGEVAENVHFLETWKPGAQLQAYYFGGTTIQPVNLVVGRRTVLGIQSVAVTVFSDEMHIPSVTKSYTTEEMRAYAAQIVQAYFKPKSSYRPYAKGLVFDDQRAVFVSFEGLDRLPKVTLTLKCFLDGSQMFDARTITVENWKPNDTKTFGLPSQAGSEADRWEISFRFEDIEHTQTLTWNRNK